MAPPVSPAVLAEELSGGPTQLCKGDPLPLAVDSEVLQSQALSTYYVSGSGKALTS